MLSFDPLDPAYLADPHPTLTRLRREEPVHRAPAGYWLLTRHADVVAGLKRPELGTGRTVDQFRALYGNGPTAEFAMRRFQYLDPPDHTRIRSLVAKAFTLRRVEGMRPRIEQLASRLLDEAAARAGEGGVIELIEEVAHPLPANVICEMLGVPESEQPPLSAWTATIPFILAPVVDPGRLAAADAAIGEMTLYVQGLIERRRKAPGDDLVTALMAAEQQGDRLTSEELAATVIFLFSAGHHTTRNLAGNALWTLMRNPDQWRRLVADRELIPAAVEECLRYEPAINFAPRKARVTFEVAGTTIPAGELVYLSLPGANRDPERFPDPGRFDITRPRNDHVAFGGGIHHCLGASLARAELQALLGLMVARYPRLTLAREDVSWRPTMTYRGLDKLWLRLG